jgi:hypothetical protein
MRASWERARRRATRGTRHSACGTRHAALSGFNAGLRVKLVDAYGMTEEQAAIYSSHGGRAGAASTMVRNGVP